MTFNYCVKSILRNVEYWVLKNQNRYYIRGNIPIYSNEIVKSNEIVDIIFNVVRKWSCINSVWKSVCNIIHICVLLTESSLLKI